MLATLPATALMYRRGDVATADLVVTLPHGNTALSTAEADAVTAGGAFDALREADLPPAAQRALADDAIADVAPFLLGPVVRRFEDGSQHRVKVDPNAARRATTDDGAIVSAGGQLAWNAKAGLVTVETESTVAAVGFLGEAGSVSLGPSRFGSPTTTAWSSRPRSTISRWPRASASSCR